MTCNELVNDALEQMNQLGKEECGVHADNCIGLMTFREEKKDKVRLLSAPSLPTIVLVEDSVFSKLNHAVKLSWKQQTKGMNRILGPCVRDKFMKDCKFCDEKTHRHTLSPNA